MNYRQLFLAVLTATSASMTFAQGMKVSEVEKTMDQRNLAIHEQLPRTDFLKSWHSNEVYMTRSEYLFDTKLRAIPNEKSGWFALNAAKGVTKGAEVVEQGRFDGVAAAKTLVFHEYPRLAMIRDYGSVWGTGEWNGEIRPTSGWIRKGIVEIKQNDKAIEAGREILESFVPVWGKWGGTICDIVGTWLSKNVGKFDNDGICRIEPDGFVGQTIGAEEWGKVINAAAQFTEDINGHKIAISAKGSGKVRRNEIQNVSLMDDVDPRESLEAFETIAKQGRNIVEGESLHSLLARESITPTKDLFDGDVRKPGDVWSIDAALFSTFLHPDLKGGFRGRAVVKYVEDRTGDDRYVSDDAQLAGAEREYDVRKLMVIPSGMINGTEVTSDFEYDETQIGGRFKAKYDSTSETELLVDMASGHILFARVILKANDVEVLPSLTLLQGFKGNGRGSLRIDFSADVYPMTVK